MATSRQQVGALGEAAAVRYLQGLGWQIVGQNVRGRHGEIDIVAVDSRTLVFVEVRTKRGRAFGTPEESLTSRKAQRMARCALDYLSASDASEARSTDWRIDFIAIDLQGDRVVRLEHYKHALAR